MKENFFSFLYRIICHTNFEIFTQCATQVNVVWAFTPCSKMCLFRRFGEACFLVQGNLCTPELTGLQELKDIKVRCDIRKEGTR